jgi:hypothetical protein
MGCGRVAVLSSLDISYSLHNICFHFDFVNPCPVGQERTYSPYFIDKGKETKKNCAISHFIKSQGAATLGTWSLTLSYN